MHFVVCFFLPSVLKEAKNSSIDSRVVDCWNLGNWYRGPSFYPVFILLACSLKMSQLDTLAALSNVININAYYN